MTPTEPLPNCRRKAIWSFAVGVLFLLVAWAADAWWQLPPGLVGAIAGMGSGGFFAALLLWFSPDTSDAVPKPLLRRYLREITIAMAAYVACMLVWKRVLGMADATWLRVLIALFPALLVGFGVMAGLAFSDWFDGWSSLSYGLNSLISTNSCLNSKWIGLCSLHRYALTNARARLFAVEGVHLS